MPTRRASPALAGAALAVLVLGACVPRATPPAPSPAPAPAPRLVPPLPSPAPAPPPQDWETGSLSAGDWRYSPSPSAPFATFESDQATFRLGCQQRRTIWLGFTRRQGDAIVIRTSYGTRRLVADEGPVHQLVVSLPVSDILLDQMAFSRGRFLVTVEGGPSLVVPAWPEFARVVEDCRGQ